MRIACRIFSNYAGEGYKSTAKTICYISNLAFCQSFPDVSWNLAGTDPRTRTLTASHQQQQVRQEENPVRGGSSIETCQGGQWPQDHGDEPLQYMHHM